MNNVEAATALVSMYGQLSKLEADRGHTPALEYAEAISIAIMALRSDIE